MTGPFYLGPEQHRLFGWYHAPAAAPAPSGGGLPRDVGIVLCNSFGFEALCHHRSIRHFAEAFARAGFPALRFDYDGTGDSTGEDRDPERVRAWLASVHHASDALKRRSGVKRVCLFGIRLGATLAATAAAERKDCAGLIAVAPILSTEQYLRELAAFHAWGRFNEAPDGAATGLADGDQEASGFVLTASTSAALRSLELPALPGSRVLILERDARASSAPWIDRLAAAGTQVEARFVKGYAEMSLDPHRSVVPERMIDAARAWLDTAFAGAGGRPAPAPTDPGSAECEAAPGVVETPVFVDGKRAVFGILSRSSTAPRNGRAILLLNAGAQHRIGPNRLWVSLARSWARTGAVVLRLDLSGLGDSSSRGEPENFVYAKAGVTDISEAVEYLRSHWGARTFDVLGLCGGAYQALKAAVHGVPIDTVLAINPQVFFWDPERSEEANVQPALIEARWYRESLRNPEAWKKLLRGGVQWRSAGRAFLWRGVHLAANLGRRLARKLRVPLKDDLARDLTAVAARKTQVRFIFSDGEPGEERLFELAGGTARKLKRRGAISVERARGTNHTFTAAWMHSELRKRVEAGLGISP